MQIAKDHSLTRPRRGARGELCSELGLETGPCGLRTRTARRRSFRPDAATTSTSSSRNRASSSGLVYAASSGRDGQHHDLADVCSFEAASKRVICNVGAAECLRVGEKMRAISRATFPFPTMTARSPERSKLRSEKSGWPLYQATNSAAE